MSNAVAETSSDDAACWYGKLASLGDFAQRRMPADCLAAFDAWLSRAMQDARELLGERWLEVYLTAPVLRFAWAPGVLDASWWFGVLMPSCDSVGRYFPLMIAQRRARAPEDRIALDHLELWYEHVAQAALLTLNDDGGSVEALEQSLHDAPPWPTAGRSTAMSSEDTEQGQHLRLAPAATLPQWLHGLAVQRLGAHLSGCSLWWRVTENRVGDTVDIAHGLPDGATFAALLSG